MVKPPWEGNEPRWFFMWIDMANCMLVLHFHFVINNDSRVYKVI
jgi:hypothetical protein